jgi:hypothetical protein
MLPSVIGVCVDVIKCDVIPIVIGMCVDVTKCHEYVCDVLPSVMCYQVLVCAWLLPSVMNMCVYVTKCDEYVCVCYQV